MRKIDKKLIEYYRSTAKDNISLTYADGYEDACKNLAKHFLSKLIEIDNYIGCPLPIRMKLVEIARELGWRPESEKE